MRGSANAVMKGPPGRLQHICTGLRIGSTYYTTVAGLSVSDRSNGLDHLGTLACAEEPVRASVWLVVRESEPQRDHDRVWVRKDRVLFPHEVNTSGRNQTKAANRTRNVTAGYGNTTTRSK